MKTNSSPWLVPATLCAVLLAPSAASAAPLAILTDVAGSVQILRGGKPVAAKSGAKLQAGDRVVSRGGKATIFYLGRPPQKVAANVTAVIGAGVAAPAGGVWRTVYAGMSSGFNARPRVAATVRNEQVTLWTPVNTKILRRPRFIWTDGMSTVSYEIFVNERGAQAPLWRAEVADTAIDYPASAPALVPGKSYEWRVQRSGSLPSDTNAFASSSFALASPSDAAAWRVATAALQPLEAGMRRNAMAAYAADKGFSGEALELLGGTSQPEKFAARVASLDETGLQLLRAIAGRNGQGALLTTLAPPPGPAIATPDAGLPVDGRFAIVPAGARKRYTDAKGLFALDLPRSWAVSRHEFAGTTLTLLGVSDGVFSFSVVVAPKPATPVGPEADAQVLALLKRSPQFAAQSPVTMPLRGDGFTATARKTTVSYKLGDKEYGGYLLGWRQGERSFAVGVRYLKSAPEIERNVRLFESLLPSLRIEGVPAGSGASAMTPEVMQAEMDKGALAAMSAINEAQGRRYNTVRDIPAKPAAALEAAEAKLKAAAPGTLARADAAYDAARAAADAAWELWDSKDTTARTRYEPLLERSDVLRRESYTQEMRFYEAEFARTEARLKELRALTPPQPNEISLNTLLDGWLTVQWMRTSQLQQLAGEARDLAAQERWANAELQVRREQLELAVLAEWGEADGLARRLRYARALENVGGVFQEKADYMRADACYVRALAWRRALPATYTERMVDVGLSNRGSLFMASGDMVQAREQYEAAITAMDTSAVAENEALAAWPQQNLAARRRATRAQARASMLNNLGFIAHGLGDYRLARQTYERAIAAVTDLKGDDFIESTRDDMRATVLGNIASLDSYSGDTEAAMKRADEQLVLLRALGEDRRIASWLLNRATLTFTRGDREGARRLFVDALGRFRALRLPKNAALAASSLARIAREDKDFPTALRYAREAMDSARVSRDGEALSIAARTLASLSLPRENSAGDWPQFDALVAEALAVDARLGDPFSTAVTLVLRANGKEKRGDNNGAITDYRAAIARLEAVRATTTSDEKFSEQEESFVAYERLVRLLLKLNRPDEAFDFLQRARSGKLRESLRLSSLKSPDPALQKLLDRASQLEGKLGTLRAQLQSERALPAADTAKVQNLTGQIAATQAEFFRVSAQLKAKNPAFDRALTISPLELKKAQSAVPANAVLVQYAPLGDDLYIFVVTSTGLKIFAPDVRSKAVLDGVRRFRAQMDAAQKAVQGGKPLASPETDTALSESLTQLYGFLITPIESELQGKETIAFVPSGALYYLPIHALARQTPQGLRFLIEDRRVVYLAAADILSIVKPRSPEQFGSGTLALGDPAGANLPAARDEVRAISQIFPASQSLVGENARKAVLLDAKNLDRRVLHLATHGILNAALPDSSYIQLAGKGEAAQLTVGEIVGLDLNRLDLVTLSACQTALGEGNPDGGEITSLAQSFSSAGARSVVASLWSVEDVSTRKLMETFYRSLAAGDSKAESLQQAQRDLLKDPATRHPFYWAPFELLGDWR